jgi:hypothetical protein
VRYGIIFLKFISRFIAHHNEVLGGWFVELNEASEIEFDDVSS